MIFIRFYKDFLEFDFDLDLSLIWIWLDFDLLRVYEVLMLLGAS